MEPTTRLQAAATADVAAAVAELVTNGSVEMGAHRPEDARAIATLVPAGTPVYVNHLPRHSLSDSLASLIAVREAGLEPVPHVAARRILNRAEVDSFLGHAVNRAGVKKVLLIGGEYNHDEYQIPFRPSALTNMSATYDPRTNSWTMIAPPASAHCAGRSPNTTNTQIGFSTGSM